MCLVSKRRSPHVLKRDRRCWKVLYHNDAGKLISVVYGMEYELGRLYTEEGEPVVVVNKHSREYLVFNGYMHAFSSTKMADLEREAYSDAKHPDGREPVICECTIPAGTEVYTDGKCHEICARTLKVDKILTL